MQDIPVIDFDTLGRAATRQSLDQACRDWGVFYLDGHTLDRELARRMFAAMHGFFAQPVALKQTVERTASNPWGFYDRELTKNVRDWKEIFDVGPDITTDGLPGARAQWPDETRAVAMRGFRETLQAYSAACEQVALRVLHAISANLGMPARYLDGCFDATQTSFLRLNHYPACANPAPADTPGIPASGHLGIHHHTDSGALTVLLQDGQAGLQVLHGEHWRLVQPRENALLVNIGDIVQVWSNDRYRAPLHRVLANATAARYSAPYFYNPSYTTVYAPLPGACDVANPARYRPIHWGEFRAARAAGDYADYGEEVQISRYRVEGASGTAPLVDMGCTLGK
jgi:isopenicillin N synthase-like dioxygenase